MALKKKEKLVSLNLKVPESLDLRLKAARKAAREQGAMFNVSKDVVGFLEKQLKKVEKELDLSSDSYKQKDLLD